MFDQIEYDEKVTRLNITTPRRLDALSARELARHERRMAMLGFIGRVARWAVESVRRWNRRRVLFRELSALPDHLLADIGFRRDQISDVVYGDLDRPAPAPAPGPAGARRMDEDARPDPEPEEPLAA